MLTASVLLRRSACSVCVLVQFGMTMVALGAGAEGRGKGITGNALWPATVIESQVAMVATPVLTCELIFDLRYSHIVSHGMWLAVLPWCSHAVCAQ